MKCRRQRINAQHITNNMLLSRFKVLDLTRVRAGPSAVRQLAYWGADVIKVEMPQKCDPEIRVIVLRGKIR